MPPPTDRTDRAVRSSERERKLAVPPRFRLPPLPPLLGATARAEPPARYTTDFFDTADLALAAWGVTLRFRTGDGWQVKLPDTGDLLMTRVEVAFPGARGQVPEAALDLLRPYLRDRPVAVSARTRTVRRRTAFIDKRGAERVELVDDRVTALTPDAGRTLRQLEIELRAADATDLLDALVERLTEAGATPDTRSKYSWVLGERAPTPELEEVDVGPDAAIRDIVRAALGSATRQLIHADAAVREGSDPEAIHQARVATRRLRSHLRTFDELLDPAWARDLRNGLRGLGDALGRVRDTEVLTDRLRDASASLDTPTAMAGIVGALGERLAVERTALSAMLAGPAHLALLERLIGAATAPPLRVDPGAPGADTLRPVLQRTWRRLRKRVRSAQEPPTDAELHRVRIEAKRARYASEALTPLAGKSAAAFARAAARLQDTLGEHQDAVVAWNWLHDAAAEGRIDRFTAGELAALQLALRDAARDRWRSAWKIARRRRPSTW